MTQPYPGQPQWGPPPERKPMRKRPAFYAVVAGTWLLTFGCTAAALSSSDSQEQDAKPQAKASSVPTVQSTVTATVTATAKPKPAVTKEIEVTETVTATVTEDSGTYGSGTSDDDAGSGSSVYYQNCTAVRAAGAAPIRAGDPGYGRHLDRDGDGVACE